MQYDTQSPNKISRTAPLADEARPTEQNGLVPAAHALTRRGFVLVVALVMGLMVWLLPNTAQAATCISLADGNWSDTSKWSCGAAPGAADMAIIKAHDMVVDVDSTIVSQITMEGGSIDTGAYTLTLMSTLIVSPSVESAVIDGSLATTILSAWLVYDGVADTDLQLDARLSGLGLIKLEAGKVAHNNTASVGVLHVMAGTWLVNGSTGLTGVMVIGSGTLGGTGTVGNLLPGMIGKLAPGAVPGPGKLTVNTISLVSSALISIEIGGPAVGIDYDQINVVGSVALAIPFLQVHVVDDYTPAGEEFVIINNDGDDAVTGLFSDLVEGTRFMDQSGLHEFEISYAGGDGNDVVLKPIIPEIGVFGNDVEIASGDNTPNVGDGTDFGTLDVGEALTQTFVISNSGEYTLTLTDALYVAVSGANSSDFTVVQPATANIGPMESVEFAVVFAPTAHGTRSATISIANSDGDENPYTFAVQGNGVAYHTVTVVKSGDGDGTVAGTSGSIDCGATCSELVVQGTVVTLVAVANAGSSFGGWSDGCTGVGVCEVEVTGPTTITVTYQDAPISGLSMDGNATAGSPLTFSAQLPMNVADSCEWDFGDGEIEACDLEALQAAGISAVTMSAIHTFTEPGEYTVTVTASNAAGTVTLSLDVTVADPTAETPTEQPRQFGPSLFLPLLSDAGND